MPNLILKVKCFPNKYLSFSEIMYNINMRYANMMENRIKEIRKTQKKTLREVADSLHTSNQNVSNWERGNSEPKLETWQKLADYFNVSVPYLQGISDENGTLFRTVDDFVSDTDYRSFDLLDNSVQITINGKDVSASDIEKIREYALFITKPD